MLVNGKTAIDAVSLGKVEQRGLNPAKALRRFNSRSAASECAAALKRFLRCSLITNHPNGRRVSVHWFAGVLQSLCSLIRGVSKAISVCHLARRAS
jgi:hypothetical protein